MCIAGYLIKFGFNAETCLPVFTKGDYSMTTSPGHNMASGVDYTLNVTLCVSTFQLFISSIRALELEHWETICALELGRRTLE